MSRTYKSSLEALCFGWACVPSICWWITLCAIHTLAEVPQWMHQKSLDNLVPNDLVQSNISETFCFGTSCVTARRTWTLKTIRQQTWIHNSSDWKQLWLQNLNLDEKPSIEGSSPHTFDDDWSLGDNKLFQPFDFQDRKE
jgi:hypothetical protein